MPKMVQFGKFMKTWSLRSNSVTRQVTLNRTKIGWKCQNWNTQVRHFKVIFRHENSNETFSLWLANIVKFYYPIRFFCGLRFSHLLFAFIPFIESLTCLKVFQYLPFNFFTLELYEKRVNFLSFNAQFHASVN